MVSRSFLSGVGVFYVFSVQALLGRRTRAVGRLGAVDQQGEVASVWVPRVAVVMVDLENQPLGLVRMEHAPGAAELVGLDQVVPFAAVGPGSVRGERCPERDGILHGEARLQSGWGEIAVPLQ